MKIEKSLEQLSQDYTRLCAELGNNMFIQFENEKIGRQGEKEKADLLSRIESIQTKAKSLKANAPKELKESPIEVSEPQEKGESNGI